MKKHFVGGGMNRNEQSEWSLSRRSNRRARALKEINASGEHCISDVLFNVQKGHYEWLAAWKRKGWMTFLKTPVKNKDLWQGVG